MRLRSENIDLPERPDMDSTEHKLRAVILQLSLLVLWERVCGKRRGWSWQEGRSFETAVLYTVAASHESYAGGHNRSEK